MERIGEGLQYKVYSLSSGRVRKIPTDELHMQKMLTNRYLRRLNIFRFFLKFKLTHIYQKVKNSIIEREKSIEFIKKN